MDKFDDKDASKLERVQVVLDKLKVYSGYINHHYKAGEIKLKVDNCLIEIDSILAE